MKTLMTLSIPVAVFAIMGSARTARAEDGPVVSTGVVKETSQTSGPNRALLHSGLWTLGLSYVPAVIVAAGSSRDGDKNLYIPVAGPWMDLAMRGDCPVNVSCNNETANKVLLVVDGIFQGLGALDILGAFVFPETRTVTVSSASHRDVALAPSLRVVPAQVSNGAYGFAAIGTF